MPTKTLYHINNNDMVTICRATNVGRCPFKENGHFEARQRAEQKAVEITTTKYGLFNRQKKNSSERSQRAISAKERSNQLINELKTYQKELIEQAELIKDYKSDQNISKKLNTLLVSPLLDNSATNEIAEYAIQNENFGDLSAASVIALNSNGMIRTMRNLGNEIVYPNTVKANYLRLGKKALASDKPTMIKYGLTLINRFGTEKQFKNSLVMISNANPEMTLKDEYRRIIAITKASKDEYEPVLNKAEKDKLKKAFQLWLKNTPKDQIKKLTEGSLPNREIQTLKKQCFVFMRIALGPKTSGNMIEFYVERGLQSKYYNSIGRKKAEALKKNREIILSSKNSTDELMNKINKNKVIIDNMYGHLAQNSRPEVPRNTDLKNHHNSPVRRNIQNIESEIKDDIRITPRSQAEKQNVIDKNINKSLINGKETLRPELKTIEDSLKLQEEWDKGLNKIPFDWKQRIINKEYKDSREGLVGLVDLFKTSNDEGQTVKSGLNNFVKHIENLREDKKNKGFIAIPETTITTPIGNIRVTQREGNFEYGEKMTFFINTSKFEMSRGPREKTWNTFVKINDKVEIEEEEPVRKGFWAKLFG